jgi:hypothetical protein
MTRSSRSASSVVVSGWVALLLLSTGCRGFNREWKKTTGAEDRLAGRWEGGWLSDKNGHHGKLRCIVTKTNEEYSARFHATYQIILHFTYAVPLRAEPDGGSVKFAGEADLGLAGGLYRYDGRADGSNFTATYTSQSDHGTFRMSRPSQ